MTEKKTKVFVGRLPDGCSSKDLEDLFARYGTVDECDVVGKYGFVHMSKAEEADDAIKKLNNYNFMGSQLSVQISTSKKKDPGGKAKKSNVTNRNNRKPGPYRPPPSYSGPYGRGPSNGPSPGRYDYRYYDSEYRFDPYFCDNLYDDRMRPPPYESMYTRRPPPQYGPPNGHPNDYYDRRDGPYSRRPPPPPPPPLPSYNPRPMPPPMQRGPYPGPNPYSGPIRSDYNPMRFQRRPGGGPPPPPSARRTPY